MAEVVPQELLRDREVERLGIRVEQVAAGIVPTGIIHVETQRACALYQTQEFLVHAASVPRQLDSDARTSYTSGAPADPK